MRKAAIAGATGYLGRFLVAEYRRRGWHVLAIVRNAEKARQSGRAWLFGDGEYQLNPIHGADLADATAQATETGTDWLNVGGPDIFTHNELAQLAFSSIGRPPKITRLPDILRRVTIKLLPYITPIHIAGPAQFFLTAFGSNMTGETHGTRHLADYFSDELKNQE